jgi:hypothetical protein
MVAGVTSAPVMAGRPGSLSRVREVYAATIVKKGRSEGFLIALSFLITGLILRGITHAIRDQRFTFLFHNVSSSGGAHVHHFVYGILILLVAGYLAIRFHPDRLWARRSLAIAYGAAAALVLDEFAVWFTFEDLYWSPQGRASVAALILAGSIFLVALEGLGFWRALLRDAAWILFRRNGDYPPL